MIAFALTLIFVVAIWAVWATHRLYTRKIIKEQLEVASYALNRYVQLTRESDKKKEESILITLPRKQTVSETYSVPDGRNIAI